MSPRIAPIDPIPTDVLARAEAAAGQTVRTDAQVYRTLATHPDLFEAWLAWGAHVVRGTSLSPELRELVVLRVALLCDGRYPLTQHVRIGRSVGLTADDIQRTSRDPSAVDWDDATTAALCSVDQLLVHRRLDDDRWADLVTQHRLEGAFDVVATVAFFRMACWMLNAAQTPFDEGQQPATLTAVDRFEAWEVEADDGPRVPPLPLEDWPVPLLTETETWPRFEGRPELRRAGVYSTLAQNPSLFTAMGPLMAHLLRRNTLTDRHREVVIVRSCLRDRGAYPYRQHVRIAGELAVPAATIDQLSSYDPHIEDPADRALVTMVDDLHRINGLTDETWQAVGEHFHEQAIMDAIATAGFYGLISFVLSTARTQLEPGTVQLPPLPPTGLDQETHS